MSEDADIRAGLPSASGANRWTPCPGSHLAEEEIKAKGIPEEESEVAEYGTRIHKVLEDYLKTQGLTAIVAIPGPEDGLKFEDGEPLEEEDLDLVRRSLRARNKIVEYAMPDVSEFDEAEYEQRLWIRDPRTFDLVASGQLDVRLSKGHRHLIIDWKTGRGLVEPAHGNPQLRTQATALLQEVDPQAEEIHVAIAQPLAIGGGPFTVATFESHTLRLAEASTVTAAIAATQQNQPRIAGLKQCTWCRFKPFCPEARTLTAMVSVNGDPLDQPVTARELDLYKLADKIMKARRDKAKQQLEADPSSIPGWELGNGRRTVTADPVVAWSKIGIRIGGAAFAEACRISVQTLAEKFAADRHIPKTQARKEVEETLKAAGGLEEKTGAPMLKAVSE
jgi:hypothetical protein